MALFCVKGLVKLTPGFGIYIVGAIQIINDTFCHFSVLDHSPVWHFVLKIAVFQAHKLWVKEKECLLNPNIALKHDFFTSNSIGINEIRVFLKNKKVNVNPLSTPLPLTYYLNVHYRYAIFQRRIPHKWMLETWMLIKQSESLSIVI